MNDPTDNERPLNSRELAQQFERLCGLLLESAGYTVQKEPGGHQSAASPQSVPDFLLRRPGSPESVVAEAKLYRSTTVSMSLLRNSIRQVQGFKEQYGASEAILLLSIPVHERRIQEACVDSGVSIWDLKKLLSITNDNLVLAGELSEFVRRASIGVLGSGVRRIGVTEFLPFALSAPTQQAVVPELLDKLATCPEGREGAQEFERLCSAALQILFGEEFASWKPQRPVEGGFHRVDLVARLAPRHQFWLGISGDFRTRYVVFEFKNYSSAIAQNQIYTTEKYLYPTALRSVAVIVAREGLDDGARHAVKGALRENGKLILWVTREELMNMLREKDAGTDPHNMLFDRLDELLVDLGR